MRRVRVRGVLALSPAMWVFVIALIGLPVVVLRALHDHAESEAVRNARQFNQLISTMRSYYTHNVAGRIMNSGGAPIVLTEDYHQLPGGVPIPATLSIELGNALQGRMNDQGFAMAFVSDAPFTHRQRPPLDDFQRSALQTFRQQPGLEETWRVEDTGFLGQRVRLAVPVRMEPTCVGCHNGHPSSPVRTWQVGDVRGIQDISVDLMVTEQTHDTLVLGLYLLFFSGASMAALRANRRANRELQVANQDLQASQQFLQESQQFLEDSEHQLKLKVDELTTLKQVLDKAPFGISIADPHQPDMPLVYVNEAFMAQTGYTEAQALGRNCRFLQGPATQPELVQQIRDAIRERRALEVELVNYRRNGEAFWNRFLLFPSFNPQGELIHFVGCQTDITALKQAEERRQQMEAELQESRKLESLGLTIAGIAHDLNTPIGVSLTAASLMEQQARKMAVLTADPQRNAEQLAKLANGVLKSANLVGNNLNKAARLVRSFKQTTADATRHEWRKVEFKAYLDSLLVSVSPLLKRANCSLTLDCPEHLVVMTEPGSLTQVLSNLLVNATVHAFQGRDDRRITLTVEHHPGQLHIVLADNGNGMQEEALAKAFTPFFTTRREAGGSGLGLFSSRRVVEEVLGGRITLHSQPGAGTTFHIHLPDTPPAAAPAPQKDPTC